MPKRSGSKNLTSQQKHEQNVAELMAAINTVNALVMEPNKKNPSKTVIWKLCQNSDGSSFFGDYWVDSGTRKVSLINMDCKPDVAFFQLSKGDYADFETACRQRRAKLYGISK